MISTKSLLLGLTALVSLDILSTILAVGYMGAIELNNMASLLGFPWFIVLKIVASVAAIYIISTYCIPSAPTITKYGISMMVGVYAAVCASNAYQIMGSVI